MIIGTVRYSAGGVEKARPHMRRMIEASRKDLGAMMRYAAERGIRPGHRVVELASNDGYLLQYFIKAGIEVLGISCVTNFAAGVVDQKLDHKEVLEVGAAAQGIEELPGRPPPDQDDERADDREHSRAEEEEGVVAGGELRPGH